MHACLLKVSAVWVTVLSASLSYSLCPERIKEGLFPQLLHFHVSYTFKTPDFLGLSDAVMELLRQNAHAFSQISSNLSVSKVIDLFFFCFLVAIKGESKPNASW